MLIWLRSLSQQRLLAVELPSLAAALATAELFYKFGSFSLECLAFLPTWFAIETVLARLLRYRDERRA
jgi:hypothetical protein